LNLRLKIVLGIPLSRIKELARKITSSISGVQSSSQEELSASDTWATFNDYYNTRTSANIVLLSFSIYFQVRSK